MDVFIFLHYLPDVAKARTALFTQIVLFELVIIFSMRTVGPFWREFGRNKYLLGACGLSIAFQLFLIYLPSLRDVMGVVPLTLFDWGLILGGVLVTFAVAEVMKGLGLLWRRRGRGRHR